MYALGGVARGGAVRGGYVSGRCFVFIDGVDVSAHVEDDSVTIIREADEVPDTCDLTLESVFPARGNELVITRGSINSLSRMFGGHIRQPKTIFIAAPGQGGSDISAIDYTVLLQGILITAHYIGQSATAILLDLFADAPTGCTRSSAPVGFSLRRIAQDLPIIDEITITDTPLDQAITQVLDRVGGTWKVDYRRMLLAFLDEDENQPNPVDITLEHPTLSAFEYDEDDSQLATRCYVEGEGTTLLGDVAAGDTMVPLVTVAMFEATGEFAKIAPPGSTGGSQHLAFTAVDPGGVGAFAGPGINPTSPLSAAGASGTGIDAGLHDYAFSWVTGAGETTPSPLAALTLGDQADPTVAPSLSADLTTWSTQAGLSVGDTVQVGIQFSFDFAFTAGVSNILDGGTISVPAWNGGGNPAVIHMLASGVAPALAHYARLYWKKNGGLYHAQTFATITPGASFSLDQIIFTALSGGAASPAASIRQAALGAIDVGPTGTTKRRVYRTKVSDSQLKLLVEIADNTTLTYTDSTADSSLGANAPSSNTSGLTQAAGNVAAGGIVIPTSGAPFPTTGGWVVIGNGEQVVRYTDVSGNSLTGIPASGIGAITAPINYGSTVTLCAMLTGIPASGAGAIREDLSSGEEIYLVVQEDDLDRQGEVADRYTTDERVDDGVRSLWVQDRRLSIAEARALARAELQQQSSGLSNSTYTVQDTRTDSCLMITIDMGDPLNVSARLKLQRVTITGIATAVDGDGVMQPTYAAEASNDRFSLPDLIRKNGGLI
ncbi:MAG TPA: hypothetical protein VHZ73_02385 [Vicinamibacterales bacterium]|nr:hypothetical protein [Vicinamibacterales bacterium]